ncbi:MAG: hypothetical protein K0Q95_2670 [Bacteroidota bacterium]|jgi:hypothetical protein|nr:hypothetical protein [Bacteroidota bacterium]
MKKSALLLFLCAHFTICFSQGNKYHEPEEFNSNLILGKKKAVVVYNGTKHSFSYEVVGDTIKPANKPYVLTVDHKLLKEYTTPINRKSDFDHLQEEFLRENLIGNMNYLKIQYHYSKDIDSNYEFMSLNGKTFIFWESLGASWNKKVDKQYYFITFCFDQLVFWTIPVMKGEQTKLTTFDKIRTTFIGIGNSLTLNNYPLDIEKLSNELKVK